MELANSNKLLRFKVSLPEVLKGEAKKTEKSGDHSMIHTSITCDECGMSPIVRNSINYHSFQLS